MQVAEINHLKQQFGIIGNAPILNRAIEIAAQVAPTRLSVLITGESGTGKESFSKLIHKLSPYKHGKFIAINCGAIPEGTIDSELFGHEKGAFTGAADQRKGYFEEAHGGTIFLDEIGEMPLSTQTKLLRVLEYGEFLKVGTSASQKIKVRVVAATNVDLLAAIAKGTFREDLYYRLNTVPIDIPPLRARGQDVVLLFVKFATECAEQYGMKPIYLDAAAQKILGDYRFPGNIRQLKNIVEHMSILSVNRAVDEATLKTYLPPEQAVLPALYTPAPPTSHGPSQQLLYTFMAELQKEVGELKALVMDLLADSSKGQELLKTYPTLFKKRANIWPMGTLSLESSGQKEEKTTYTCLPAADGAEAVTLPAAPPLSENLSLADKEKELIVKALKKFKHKRKKAAETLGISDRTLYRKINQYNLNGYNFE